MSVEIPLTSAISFWVRRDFAGELCVDDYPPPSYEAYKVHCDRTDQPCTLGAYRAFRWRIANRGPVTRYRLWLYRGTAGIKARMGDMEWSVEVPFEGLVSDLIITAYAASRRPLKEDGYLLPEPLIVSHPDVTRTTRWGLCVDVADERGYIVPIQSLFQYMCRV